MKLFYTSDVMISRHSSSNQMKGHTFGQRTVEMYELDYITGSDGGVITTDGTSIALKPGMLFIRIPGMVVEGYARYDSFYLRFLVDKYDFSLPFMIIPGDIKRFHSIFEQIYETHVNHFSDEDYIYDILINQIFYECYLCNSKEKQENLGGLKNMVEVIQLMHLGWNKTITLDMLVSQSGYSKSRFCHLFKELYGATPMDYLMQIRIAFACRLLIESNEAVKEIMVNCGYINEQLFFRHFKKYTGCSPLQYRKQHYPWPIHSSSKFSKEYFSGIQRGKELYHNIIRK